VKEWLWREAFELSEKKRGTRKIQEIRNLLEGKE